MNKNKYTWKRTKKDRGVIFNKNVWINSWFEERRVKFFKSWRTAYEVKIRIKRKLYYENEIIKKKKQKTLFSFKGFLLIFEIRFSIYVNKVQIS